MRIHFYTPACGANDEQFGAASFGFVGAEDENRKTEQVFPIDIKGDFIFGTYEECLQQVAAKPYQAGIILTGNAGRENAFVKALSEKISIPLVGGGAAINPETGEKGLISGRGDAAVFLILDDRYQISVETKNIHEDVLSTHSISFTNPRIIDSIDGQDASQWLKKEKEKHGLEPTDFEHLTLADMYGINAHLSEIDGKIHSGRDLMPEMVLRYVHPKAVHNRMETFYNDPNAIVFGCAGLKGILSAPLKASGLGLFMFGEVCTVNGISGFGNLMLSKICVLPR